LIQGRRLYDAFRRSLHDEVVELGEMEQYQLTVARKINDRISPFVDTRPHFEPVSDARQMLLKGNAKMRRNEAGKGYEYQSVNV
jgi:hypothetical protein